jgi:L-threonylcarbamoyladenylate synthase
MVPLLSPTPENVRSAAEALRAGNLVAMPTETVYGLAGNALDPAVLARIFEVKKRPFFDPLIVHVAERKEIDPLVREIPEGAEILMARFWPGPLTLVLPKSDRVPGLATAGLDTVAVRVPAHPVAQALLREAGIPLAAPSANPFGALSPTTATHVTDAFSEAEGIACVLDGGPCAIGVESTVLGWDQGRPVLMRAGGVPLEALEEALGTRIARFTAPSGDDATPSPGALPWHYAPRTPLRMLDENENAAHEATARGRAGLLWFGDAPAPVGYARTENLSPEGSLREAATNLFAMLHRLDAAGLEELHARGVPEHGLGRAVNERLRKAAAAPRARR